MDNLPKNEDHLKNLFDLSGKVTVVTGGGGVICQLICKSLAQPEMEVFLLMAGFNQNKEPHERCGL